MNKNEKRAGYIELRVKLFSDSDLKLFLNMVDAMAVHDHGLSDGISVYRLRPECQCPPCNGRDQTWADVEEEEEERFNHGQN